MSFLKTAYVVADDPSLLQNAMKRLRDGDLGAIIVRDVYPADALAKLPPQLARNAFDLVKTTFPPAFHAFFYGINLNLADPEMGAYFAAEPDFRSKLAGIDFCGADLQSRICAILSGLDQGLPYGAAPGPQDGQQHFFTTLRAHETGGYIPPHFDNEAAVRPTYRHIAALCDADIYSFVLCIDQAEAGGALEVYNVNSQTDARSFQNRDGDRVRPDLSQVEKTAIRLNPGEMVVLHSSRYLHGVSKVEGDRTRWTVCSFMALTKDGTQVFCWG